MQLTGRLTSRPPVEGATARDRRQESIASVQTAGALRSESCWGPDRSVRPCRIVDPVIGRALRQHDRTGFGGAFFLPLLVGQRDSFVVPRVVSESVLCCSPWNGVSGRSMIRKGRTVDGSSVIRTVRKRSAIQWQAPPSSRPVNDRTDRVISPGWGSPRRYRIRSRRSSGPNTVEVWRFQADARSPTPRRSRMASAARWSAFFADHVG